MELNDSEAEKLRLAGRIARSAVEYAKSLARKDMPLLELAEKTEARIVELGGKPAFPVNLSINEIAAHATPLYDDEAIAHGLLKVDIGVHVGGWIADTAFSLDLENSEENKKLIEAAEQALNKALEEIKLKKEIKLRKIGHMVEREIISFGFNPVRNLSGHSISEYEVHAGITIPNYDNKNEEKLEEGVFAVEPFSTNGHGLVKDGKPSGIYHLVKEGNVRDGFARSVLDFIKQEYRTLPFCSRWIVRKFGSRGLVALRFIEQAGLLHNYAQLVETSKGKVAQAESTFLVHKGETEVIT